MSKVILRVQMFGRFTLTYADKQISCNRNRSKLIWNIIAYLICHRGEYVSIDNLISLIWKRDQNDNPAGAMRTAIHRARAILAELGDDEYIISGNGGYMWNPNVEMLVDTDEFERLALDTDTGMTLNDIDSCLKAIELYESKFLPMQSSELWVMPIQAYYQNRFETLIDLLVPLLEETKRYAEGVAVCRKALQIEQYSETLYQYLMRFLLANHEREEVIHVYEELSRIFLSTFGIMPDQESRALYREALQSLNANKTVSPEELQTKLREQGVINSALICDFDFYKMLYRSHARAVVRSGLVIHTALITLKSRSNNAVSEKNMALAMDNLEKHMGASLRKGDVIARCSSSQFTIMLSSANYENSCKVCQRFIGSFERKYPHSPIYIDYFVQALIPSTES